MLGSREGYVPLEGHDPSSSSEECTLDADKGWPRLISDRLTYLATVTVTVCTIVDLLVLFYLGAQFRLPVPPDATHAQLRSSYINLDVLYSKGNVTSSPHRPIVNHALSFVQVSLTEPDRIIPTHHTGSYERRFGPIPLVERRLLVTPQISTVAQFRTIDFGMESCTLAVGIPSLNETRTETVGRVDVSPAAFTLDVYALPISEKLDLQTVSYASLPTAKTLFARLSLLEGTVVQTPRFSCRTLSYHTFLLACSRPADCHLDLIRTTYDTTGLFMYQYQTI